MMRVRLAVIGVVMVVASSAAQEKKIDNPEYTSWAKFKPGTTTKMKMATEVGGSKSESAITSKLVEVAADKLVLEVETETTVMGQSFKAPATKRDVPKQLSVGTAPATPTPAPTSALSTEEGAETLKLAGIEVKTKWRKYTTTAGGNETVGQVWMSDDVPNGVVKSVTTSAAFSSTMELVEFVKK
jgi:hypothetical protein